MIRNPRVVITGMGILAPSGIGADVFWDSLVNCRTGVSPITHFDPEGFNVQVAGEVQDFDLTHYIREPIKPKRMSRYTQLSVAAFKMAIDHAKLSIEELRSDRPVPLVMGVSTSAIEVVVGNQMEYIKRGPNSVNPNGVSSSQPHAVSLTISDYFGLHTKAVTISTACPAGVDAIAYAAGLIRSGKADIAITGGADAPITPVTMASLCRAGLAPRYELPPDQCSRPFDMKRKGGVISEGAAVFVLESLNHAMARGAYPWAEILGSGVSVDRRDEEAYGLCESMEEAMANAGKRINEIDYISAHGPSHPVIDRLETSAIKKTFKERAYAIPVSSIKGVIGNPLAAAGPLQIAACALGMSKGVVTPTANYEHPDPDCDLDYVPNRPYHMSYSTCLVNVHGLGGGNSSVVIGKVESA